jgi:hypothetical protein
MKQRGFRATDEQWAAIQAVGLDWLRQAAIDEYAARGECERNPLALRELAP